MSAPTRVLNDMFSQHVGTADGKEKIAQHGGTFIRDRLREVSFTGKIIPAEPVTRADCQISVNHDTLCKIVHVEPKSRALSMSFRGQPTARWIRGARCEVAFFTISSEMQQKSEQELMVYDYPITKVIEDNNVKDLQEIVDREFIINCDACVQALQKEANGNVVKSLNASHIKAGDVVEFSVRKGELARAANTNDVTVRPLQRIDLVNLFKMLDSNRLRSERVLMTEGDWDDLLAWTVEDLGSKLQSETAVDGWKWNTLLGRAYVRTIKGDILRSGNIYCFTRPDFLGKYFILNQTKFYIDKIANMIHFQAWMDVGMCLVNIASVRKLELYSADATSNNEDGKLDNFLPVNEDAIGAENNRVDAGLRFPVVDQY